MSKLNQKIKKARRDLENVDKLYGAKLEKLEQEKADADTIGLTSAEWSSDRQVAEFELDSLLTKKMMMEAGKFDVPLPHRPVYRKDDPGSDENEHWYSNPIHGRYSLTQRGRDYLDDAIWKKEERKYNRWSRYVTLAIGLIGCGKLENLSRAWEQIALSCRCSQRTDW
ncbi:MAG: hypothetical protein JWQ87_3928 [Candidatus Sulfotelmatobacter sp.]|nr:hypothetical protein [Candidatus Sulfotelmatobacter sp.]